MFNPINIYSVGNFFYPVKEELPNLKVEVKAACGKHVRRIDRFTQLALIGATQCVKDIPLHHKTGLYLSSIYGSLNNSLDVLKDMFKDGGVPSPLKFVNTVSNAACFHLAEQLALQANNQFIARDDFALEGCLKFAELDLQLGRIEAALVGVVCEVGLPLVTHRQRLLASGVSITADEHLGEASHWLLLANKIQGQEPLARLVLVAEPLSDEVLFEQLRRSSSPVKLIDVVYGKQLSEIDKKTIEQAYSFNRCDYLKGKPAYEFTSGLSVCEWLAAAPSDRRLVHLDKNSNGQWSLLIIEK
jgi:hypothetical protein